MLLLLPLIYVAGYAALLAPMVVVHESSGGLAFVERHVGYRMEGQAVSMMFAPIHWMDRKVRPGYWAGEDLEPW